MNSFLLCLLKGGGGGGNSLSKIIYFLFHSQGLFEILYHILLGLAGKG